MLLKLFFSSNNTNNSFDLFKYSGNANNIVTSFTNPLLKIKYIFLLFKIVSKDSTDPDKPYFFGN